MDDPDCDSTWEEDEGAEDGEDDASDEDAGDEDGDSERPRPGAFQSRMTGYRNWRAMQDMCRYRRHYPDLIEQDCNGDMSNLSFYKNEICFQPNGCFIEDFLQNWKDNYDVLEENHSYIQWLFPLREPGVNWHAKPLTLREVEAFKSSKEIRERFVQAYELMLGFYGIQLEDRDTGAVCRAKNYQQRFQNLNCRSHNNLRITRILKSLGELGLQHYQAPLVHFFLQETLVNLQLPGVLQSALDYFLFAVRCPRQRRELIHFAWKHFRPRCKFVWGPHDKLRRFRPQAAPRPLVGPGQAVGDEGPGDPLQKAETQGWSCGADQTGEGRVAEGPELLSTKRQDVRTLDKDQEDEAESLSPKDSKKRKLEANRQEQASGEPDPQGVSDVEKIALNLEGCALGPGSQELGEAEQPRPSAPKASVSDEVRKRRKVEEGAGGDGRVTNHNTEVLPLALLACSETHSGENEFEDPKSQVEPEQGTPENLVEDLGCPVGDSGSPVEDPGSPVEDPSSLAGDPKNLVENPGSSMEGSGTAGTAVDESGKVAGMETAKPPKP